MTFDRCLIASKAFRVEELHIVLVKLDVALHFAECLYLDLAVEDDGRGDLERFELTVDVLNHVGQRLSVVLEGLERLNNLLVRPEVLIELGCNGRNSLEFSQERGLLAFLNWHFCFVFLLVLIAPRKRNFVEVNLKLLRLVPQLKKDAKIVAARRLHN